MEIRIAHTMVTGLLESWVSCQVVVDLLVVMLASEEA